MTHWLLTPWRIGCLIAGTVIPAAVLLVAAVWYAPSVLRWAPPNPGAIAARYTDAMNDARAGDLESALDALQALRVADPFNGLIHAAIAEVQYRRGDLAAATAAAQAAVAADPTLGQAWYNLACYLLEGGRAEAALAALHESVAAGFDARDAARDDPDLDPLRDDPRWAVYLEGADLVPRTFRTASFHVAPSMVFAGEPFTLTLDVFSLNHAGGAPTPVVSVEYLGPEVDRTLAPIRAEQRLQIVDTPRARHFVWTFRYRLRGVEPVARTLGPWEIQVEGVRLVAPSPRLNIQGSTPEKAGFPPDRATDAPAFLPRAFFRVPPPITWRPGTTLATLDALAVPWRGFRGLVAMRCRPDMDLSAPPRFLWADRRPVAGRYDLLVDAPGTGRCAARLFAVPDETLETSPRKAIRIEIDDVTYALRPVSAEVRGRTQD